MQSSDETCVSELSKPLPATFSRKKSHQSLHSYPKQHPDCAQDAGLRDPGVAAGLPHRRAAGGFSLNKQGCHISDLKCNLFVQTDRRAAGRADLRPLARARLRGRHLPPLRGE